MEPARNFPPEPGEISLKDMIERALELRDEARWILAAERRAREAAHQDDGPTLEVPSPRLPEPGWEKSEPTSPPREPDDPRYDQGILMPRDSLPIPEMPRNDSDVNLGCNGLESALGWLDAEIEEIEERIESIQQGPKSDLKEVALDIWRSKSEERRKDRAKKEQLKDWLACKPDGSRAPLA